MNKSAIIGVGFHVPENVVTNQDLTTMMDTSPDWIKTRSGIEERRWVQGDEAASDLAIPAARKAIEMAGVSPEEIDIVIVATLSADYFSYVVKIAVGILDNLPQFIKSTGK